jgi:hypothetical protein
VVVGGLFLGMLTAYLYKNWMLDPQNVTGLVLYSIVAPRLLLIPSSTIANLVTSLFIFCTGAVFALRISAITTAVDSLMLIKGMISHLYFNNSPATDGGHPSGGNAPHATRKTIEVLLQRELYFMEWFIHFGEGLFSSAG